MKLWLVINGSVMKLGPHSTWFLPQDLSYELDCYIKSN